MEAITFIFPDFATTIHSSLIMNSLQFYLYSISLVTLSHKLKGNKWIRAYWKKGKLYCFKGNQKEKH